MEKTVKHHEKDHLDKDAVYLARIYNYLDRSKGRTYHAWVVFDKENKLIGRKHDSRLYVLGRWEELYYRLDGRTLVEIVVPGVEGVNEVMAKLETL